MEIPLILEWLCTAAFAMSGVMAARDAHADLDIFGVMVVGVLTALGGGTLRDVLLGVPVFWLTRSDMLYWAMVVSTMGFFLVNHLPHKLDNAVQVLDAIGLAIFSVYGAHKAQLLGAPWMSCIYMGVLTGVGGGMMRDICTVQIPMVMRREVYATAALAGTICVVALPDQTGIWLGMLTCLMLRMAAIKWKLSIKLHW